MPFTIFMDEDSSILTAGLLVWVNILGPLVLWDSPIIFVLVNLLQDCFWVGIYDETVGFWLGSELGSPLGALLDSETWPHIGLQLILYTPPGSKVSNPDLLGSFSQATITVTTLVFCPKFLQPPYRTHIISNSHTTLDVTLSEAWPSFTRRSGLSLHFSEIKRYNEVENKW